MPGPYLGEGRVGHARVEKVKNSFSYPTFFLFFRADQDSKVKEILTARFRGLLRFEPKDYLKGEGGSLEPQIRSFIKENFNYSPDEIWLQTLPRMFGYAFNPVSFWLCLKADRLEAVLCEVNNTFGERHMYWVKKDNYEPIEKEWMVSEKVFHVSPFLPVEGSYKFRFSFQKSQGERPPQFRADIIYRDPNERPQLTTYVEGQLLPLESRSFSGLMRQYGWLTVLVVLRIHYHALRLWLKKVRYFSKPAPPEKFVT